MSTGHASSEKNAMKIGRVMLAGSSTAARHFCLCWPCVTVACLVLSGGGVVVVVVWHIIRPVSMWSRNAESQCHSVLRYANLSLAQSYRSLRQWPFRISRSLQFNERFYRKCSINLFLHTHDRWIFELMMDETAIVPMIMAIYCNFLFPKMHSMTAGNAGTS